MVKIILTAGQVAQCPALDTNPCKVSEFYLNYFIALARNACKDFSCNGTFLIWSLGAHNVTITTGWPYLMVSLNRKKTD